MWQLRELTKDHYHENNENDYCNFVPSQALNNDFEKSHEKWKPSHMNYEPRTGSSDRSSSVLIRKQQLPAGERIGEYKPSSRMILVPGDSL